MNSVAIRQEPQTESQKAHRALAHSYSTQLRKLVQLMFFLTLLAFSTQLYAATACVSIDGGDPVCTEIPSPDPIILPGSGDGGGGSGSGSDDGLGGGAGPSGPIPHQGPVLDRSPAADDNVNCTTLGELRWAYAGTEVIFNRLESGPGLIPNALNGDPAPATAFTIEYGNGQRESYVAGPYGSPTTAIAQRVPGTCHE